uniref:Di-and tripeptidase n=1 Tax=Neobacillus citreus TaxID=2833578 RepID=A0A942T1H6_9BACI
MARTPKDQAIVPMPNAPVQPAAPQNERTLQPTRTTGWVKWLDRVLNVQRPVVVAHVNGIRRRHPEASPAEVIQLLERQYLTAVTTGGAAVGASAVIPGVGMAAALGLSGAETVGFLETTALFAQSVTEVHGIALDDPERARTLVMAMILGAPGTQLINQLAGQAAGGQARAAFWGEMVTSSLPKQVVNGIGGQVRDQFVKRFAARQGGTIVGRALPFGIGAAVGGLGNHALGRKVIQASRTGFGPPPAHFPVVLEPKRDRQPKPDKQPKRDKQSDGGSAARRGLPWGRKDRADEDLWADTPGPGAEQDAPR